MFDGIAANIIKIIEKSLLTVIAFLTIIATIQEIILIYNIGTVNLADLLLLFVNCASVPKLPETCAIKILSYKSIYTLITNDYSRRAGIYFTCIGAIEFSIII